MFPEGVCAVPRPGNCCVDAVSTSCRYQSERPAKPGQGIDYDVERARKAIDSLITGMERSMKEEKGLTLTEITISVVIIANLAPISLPAHMDCLRRPQIFGAIVALLGCSGGSTALTGNVEVPTAAVRPTLAGVAAVGAFDLLSLLWCDRFGIHIFADLICGVCAA